MRYLSTLACYLAVSQPADGPTAITVRFHQNGSTTPEDSNGDNSKYNALQVELKKRVSQGIILSASCTWSRSMALEYAGLLKESSPQDNNNVQADYGPTD